MSFWGDERGRQTDRQRTGKRLERRMGKRDKRGKGGKRRQERESFACWALLRDAHVP